MRRWKRPARVLLGGLVLLHALGHSVLLLRGRLESPPTTLTAAISTAAFSIAVGALFTWAAFSVAMSDGRSATSNRGARWYSPTGGRSSSSRMDTGGRVSSFDHRLGRRTRRSGAPA